MNWSGLNLYETIIILVLSVCFLKSCRQLLAPRRWWTDRMVGNGHISAQGYGSSPLFHLNGCSKDPERRLSGHPQLLWFSSSLNTELSCKPLQEEGSGMSGRGGQIFPHPLGSWGLCASRLGKKNKEEGKLAGSSKANVYHTRQF